MYAFHLAYRENTVRHAFVMKPHIRSLDWHGERYYALRIGFCHSNGASSMSHEPNKKISQTVNSQIYFIPQLDESFCVISNFEYRFKHFGRPE